MDMMKEDRPHDRTTAEPARADFPDAGLGDSLREFLAQPVQPEHRVRNLLPTFRSVPGEQPDTTGFPGTRAFAPHRPDSGAAGADCKPTNTGPDGAPAAAPSPDELTRRRTAILEARFAARANRSTVSAGKSAAGGGLRGRAAGSVAGSGKTEVAPGPERRSEPKSKPKSKSKQSKKAAKASAPVALPAALPASIKKLVAKPNESSGTGATSPATPTPRLVPTESERQDARRLFREIGQRFNENRKKSKTAAYAAFRHDLMDNLDTLIMGGALDLKEATTIITNLEQYTRETEQESTETPATILGRWLRMDPAEMAVLEKESEAAVEEDAEPEEEEEGSEAPDES